MKKILLISTLGLFTAVTAYAQVDSSGTVASPASQTADSSGLPATAATASDSTIALLDKAVAASKQGDKTATAQALQAGAVAMETEAKTNSGSFKDKLVKQAGNLKKLVPLVKTGGLSGNLLQKAVSLAKTAFAANKIETLLGGGSLLSNLGGITSNLGILKGALPGVGGSTASTGTSLVSGAISSLSKLGQAGPVASVAEPAVRSQLTSVLSLVKGIL